MASDPSVFQESRPDAAPHSGWAPRAALRRARRRASHRVGGPALRLWRRPFHSRFPARRSMRQLLFFSMKDKRILLGNTGEYFEVIQCLRSRY
jgi:hypothetical protein